MALAEKSKPLHSTLTLTLYTRYPIVARALGLVRARAKESCIQTLTITLTSTITQTTTKTLTLTINLTFSLKWPCHVMSRDRCSFFAYNLSGKHFNPTSCGVIQNQRSKIRLSNITSTAGCLFWKILKFECRVIKHARVKPQFSSQRTSISELVNAGIGIGLYERA